MANMSRKAGVKYIIIGVGDLVDEEELRIVTGSNPNHIFRLNNFDELQTIVPEIAIQLCQVAAPAIDIEDQACGSKQEADIMFLMDSVNAGKRNTRTALAFLKSIVNELDIDYDNIHVGLMSAECVEDTPGFGLGSHASQKQIEMTVDSMKGTDFHEIIKSMRRGSFRTSKDARKHARKIAILIIDGALEEPLKTLTEAQRAKIHGVEVFVIQVGDEEPQEELLMMCDQPSSQHFYKVKHYEELQQLKEKLLESLCDEL